MNTPIERLEPFCNGLGKAILREVAEDYSALQSQLDTAIQSSAHWQHQCTNLQAEVEKERKSRQSAQIECEALKARLARVPLKGAEPVAWGAFIFGGKRDGKVYAQCDTQEEVKSYIAQVHQSSDSITLRAGPLYAAPQAPAPEKSQEPVAWLGFNERFNLWELCRDKPSPTIIREFNMRPLIYGDSRNESPQAPTGEAQG